MSKSVLRLLTIVFFSVLWTLNPIPFVSSEQNLNFESIEKDDIRLLKNEIIALKLSPERNIFDTTFDNPINSFESSIYEMEEVSSKEETSNLVPIDIKTKRREGKNSIFVQGFQSIQKFPGRRKFNCYDASTNRLIKPSVMLKAHLTCIKNIEKLPRQIVEKDKKIKFDKKYSGLFKKNENYEKVFGYNLYFEENLGKDSSKNKIKQGEQKLFKKYGEASKNELSKKLFQNPCIVKSEKCKYLETEKFVTIYYDELTDLFAVIDSNKNTVLDFGIATEVKYAEIFAYKSIGTKKIKDLCVSEKTFVEYQNQIPQDNENNEPAESKEVEIYKEPYILEYDDALAILQEKYGENSMFIVNGEFKIQEWQVVKKIEHAVCFGIKPEDYGFSQEQAKAINKPGGIVSYVRKGQKLPSLDFIRAYQNAIKNFCEDRNQSDRNDKTTFRGEPSITFCNQKTRQVVIFDRETKIFITAYKISPDQLIHNPGGGSGNGSALPANQIPENDEWVTDPYVWDKAQDKDSSTSEEEEKIKQGGKLEADIDFQYEYDSNGNPTLLVPNPGKARTKRNYNRVEFEQTLSHMHHAPDFNIPLPSDFDMSHYMNLDRAGRIDYAKQNLSREIIISYQNEIGKSMSPLFGRKKTVSVPGFAGKYKQNTELTIQQADTPNNTILSIIREDGLHISSYSIDDRTLRQLTKDNFWVLKNRNV